MARISRIFALWICLVGISFLTLKNADCAGEMAIERKRVFGWWLNSWGKRGFWGLVKSTMSPFSANLEDLARAANVDRSYVGRLLRLTSLAPDIIEAILAGNEPEGISLARLRKDLPVIWEEQRELCKIST